MKKKHFLQIKIFKLCLLQDCHGQQNESVAKEGVDWTIFCFVLSFFFAEFTQLGNL